MLKDIAEAKPNFLGCAKITLGAAQEQGHTKAMHQIFELSSSNSLVTCGDLQRHLTNDGYPLACYWLGLTTGIMLRLLIGGVGFYALFLGFDNR